MIREGSCDNEDSDDVESFESVESVESMTEEDKAKQRGIAVVMGAGPWLGIS